MSLYMVLLVTISTVCLFLLSSPVVVWLAYSRPLPRWQRTTTCLRSNRLCRITTRALLSSRSQIRAMSPTRLLSVRVYVSVLSCIIYLTREHSGDTDSANEITESQGRFPPIRVPETPKIKPTNTEDFGTFIILLITPCSRFRTDLYHRRLGQREQTSICRPCRRYFTVYFHTCRY